MCVMYTETIFTWNSPAKYIKIQIRPTFWYKQKVKGIGKNSGINDCLK